VQIAARVVGPGNENKSYVHQASGDNPRCHEDQMSCPSVTHQCYKAGAESSEAKATLIVADATAQRENQAKKVPLYVRHGRGVYATVGSIVAKGTHNCTGRGLCRAMRAGQEQKAVVVRRKPSWSSHRGPGHGEEQDPSWPRPRHSAGQRVQTLPQKSPPWPRPRHSGKAIPNQKAFTRCARHTSGVKSGGKPPAPYTRKWFKPLTATACCLPKICLNMATPPIPGTRNMPTSSYR
jgi:hypothetical protein